MMRLPSRAVVGAATAAALGVGAAAGLAASSRPDRPGDEPVKETVSASACGGGGTSVAAGPVSFALSSTAPGFTAVYLLSSGGDVVAEEPSLGEGDTHVLTATLTGGRYALRCVLTDATIHDSSPITVVGTVTPAAAGVAPMRSLDMVAPVQAYTRWVAARLPALVSAARRLDHDVAAGHLAAARRDWLAAHLDYERLGAAYGAFGELDDRIDGRPDGLPGGVTSPAWSGFLAIEHGLWSGRPTPRTRALTASLATATASLEQDFPSDEIDPGDLPLRAHEIMEDALQLQLTGSADYGSGTTLATAYANTQGTSEILDVLAPELDRVAPTTLATARRQLSVVQAALLSARRTGGRWIPVAQMDAAARGRLDAAVGALLETLSALPGALSPRNGA